MGVADFIDSIQKFLFFFVPGFISLRIKKVYGFQKTHEKFTLSVYALLYSFIIQIFYMIILYIAKKFFPYFFVILSPEIKYIIKVLVYLTLGIAFGIFIAKFSKTDIKRWLEKAINPKYSPGKSVWEVALSTKYRAAHVKVFLKNGIIYYGTLGEHTSDPDDTEKELLVYDYVTYTYNKEGWTPIELENNINGSASYHDKEKVYINAQEISSIEISPKAKKVDYSQSQIQLTRKKNLKRILYSTLFVKIFCCLGSLLIGLSSILPYFTIYSDRSLIEERFGFILLFIALAALISSLYKKYIFTLIMSFLSFVFFMIECDRIALLKSITMSFPFLRKSPIHYGWGIFMLFVGCLILFLFSVWGIYRESAFFRKAHSENDDDYNTFPVLAQNVGEITTASEQPENTRKGSVAPTNANEAPADSE